MHISNYIFWELRPLKLILFPGSGNLDLSVKDKQIFEHQNDFLKQVPFVNIGLNFSVCQLFHV